MRRFNNSYSSLLILFTLSFLVASCGGGTDSGSSTSGSSLVGTWLEIALNSTPESNPATDVYYSDGRVSSIRVGCDIRGTWVASGNRLTTTVTEQADGASSFCDDVGTVIVETYTVNATTLNVSGTEVINGGGGSFDYTLTYTRQ